MNLGETIERIKSGVSAGRYTSEAAVREAIVLPVLRALGWDDLDPDRVIREHSLGGRRVDYALAAFGTKPTIFIEVKSPGPIAGGDKQLFEYAFHEGIPLAILTNGREWNFYLPGAPGTYDERVLYKLDFVDRQSADLVQRLQRYLEFERVRSGTALEDANRDYKSLHNQRVVRDTIPKAWAQLLEEPDALIVELLTERTASLCGIRPEPDEIDTFLATLVRRARPITQPPGSKPPPPPKAPPPAPPASGTLDYRLFDRRLSARSAIDIVIAVLRELAARDPEFLDKFARVAPGRSRNHVARRAEDVYPGQPQLLRYVMELAPGWHFGTNINNRDKKRLLEVACQVAGLKFGSDLVVDLPHATPDV